jgi:hypothetical protein
MNTRNLILFVLFFLSISLSACSPSEVVPQAAAMSATTAPTPTTAPEPLAVKAFVAPCWDRRDLTTQSTKMILLGSYDLPDGVVDAVAERLYTDENWTVSEDCNDLTSIRAGLEASHRLYQINYRTVNGVLYLKVEVRGGDANVGTFAHYEWSDQQLALGEEWADSP